MGNTYGLERLGLINPGTVYRNLPVARLIEIALARGEGLLAPNGALCVNTGKYTGRSPNDRFIVDTPVVHDTISWGGANQPVSETTFERLYQRLTAYLQGKDLFVFDGFVGSDPAYRMPIRIVNQYAWQNLFVQQLFVRPTAGELAGHEPRFTVICAPGFQAVPASDGTRSEAFIFLNFDRRLVLIGGTSYAGEIK
ncbi:MAG: phosphoenolpyruvate carboxykinase (ATP), partial [Moorella sp. (in: Bacteria)]|nr:phosphoenolpyruvate carboxykinase (ATP) [Moorella sp. (in: firmicutes)]